MNGQLIHILSYLGIIFISIRAEEKIIPSSPKSITEIFSLQAMVPQNLPVCETTNLPNGKLYVNCADKNIKELPKNLDENNIQILNISSNPMLAMLGYLWKNFTNLEELIMHHVNIEIIDEDFLVPMKKLEILDISYTFASLNDIQIPSTIRRLVMNHLNTPRSEERLDLSHLDKLTDLTAKSNHLKMFPKLNETCSIVFVDLSDNPLQLFKYQDLAPFCTLEFLILYDTKIQSGEFCCGLNEWMLTFDIVTTLTCDSCHDQSLDNEAVDLYYGCELRLGVNQTISLTLLLELFFIFALIGATIFLAYRYYSSPAVVIEEQKGVEEETLPEEINT